MIVEDIQTDVAATVDKARKLVQSDNVDLVMGPIGSDANDAAYAEVVEAGGKLLFYTETYEGGKCNELYFSFGAVPAQQIRPLIPILQEAYGTNAMLFGADYVWPRRSFEIAKPIIEENGGTVVSELYLPLIAEDFSELVQEVRDTQPDYIFSLYPAVWGAALKALDDAGLLESVGIGTIFLGDPDFAGIADLAEGSYTALPFFTVADAPGVQPFLEAYARRVRRGRDPLRWGRSRRLQRRLPLQAGGGAGGFDRSGRGSRGDGRPDLRRPHRDGGDDAVSPSPADHQPRPGPGRRVRAGRFVRGHGPRGGLLVVSEGREGSP